VNAPVTSLKMRLDVFFSLQRDGIHQIWSNENVTADEGPYHVLPFPLTATAMGTDISWEALGDMMMALGLPELQELAWYFALACTAIEKKLAASGFQQESIVFAEGPSRIQRARLIQQRLTNGGGGGPPSPRKKQELAVRPSGQCSPGCAGAVTGAGAGGESCSELEPGRNAKSGGAGAMSSGSGRNAQLASAGF
jgi:hypothetical protein